MLPGRFSRLPHHVYKTGDIDLLKLNVMYGANGAGKSNMIKALSLLKSFVLEGKMPIEFITQTFKFDKESKTKDVYLGIEFIKDEVPYYYGLTINQGIVVEEELQVSGLGKKEDRMLFLRTDEVYKKNLQVDFGDNLKANNELILFPSFFQNEILERNKSILSYLKSRQSKEFDIYKEAIEWFEDNLGLAFPQSRMRGLAVRLENNDAFYQFAVQTMQTSNTGIVDIHVETVPVEDFFGQRDKAVIERFVAQMKNNPEDIITDYDNAEAVFVMENNNPVVKKITFSHEGANPNIRFEFSEESDGTKRLMEYLFAFFLVINNNETQVIDEIERSIHPLLIKELIKKFSHDENTKGQLIFSTHESNLLDQDIFRPDEIWFAEKNKEGATEFSALSDFKEHHTIDIRKGYLNGRYGGIPFLGNLKDLNWDKYVEA